VGKWLCKKEVSKRKGKRKRGSHFPFPVPNKHRKWEMSFPTSSLPPQNKQPLNVMVQLHKFLSDLSRIAAIAEQTLYNCMSATTASSACLLQHQVGSSRVSKC